MPDPGSGEFVYAWQFDVAVDQAAAFESAYGPGGDWARLFSRDPGYLGTWLLRDPQRPGRYLTLDRWRSRAARDGFLTRYQAEYDALDERCNALTVAERHLGDFELLPD